MKENFKITIIMVLMLASSAILKAQDNIITLQPDKAKAVIRKDIYGHFSEHLGHCIYEGIWVGENSTIPNTRGIRNDVASALRDMGIPNLRWPGGCFADEYHWKNGIGPRAQRPTMINTNWGGVTEDNSFGTHEFMDLCEQLGCDPVITGNLGSGSVEEMSQWVEYLNSDNVSPMTDLRKKNGHEKAWKVKFWGIGNESWGCGGAMSPEHYFDELMQYSNFCRNYSGNNLYRIAVGASEDDYNWTETIMRLWSKKSPWDQQQLMNAISLHYYTVCNTWENKGSATVFSENDWMTTLSKTMRIDEMIKKHLAIMDKYDPTHKIGLSVDEWGNWFNVEPGTNPGFLYQQNTMRDAIIAGVNLNIFNSHADRIVMANIAQVINVLQSVILTKKEQIVLTPTYYVFKMYKVHQGATMIPVSVTCRDYTLEGKTVPSISVSASIDNKGRTHITLVNLDPNAANPVSLNLGLVRSMSVTGEVITSKNMNDFNDFGVAAKVAPAKFDGFKLNGSQLVVNMPAKSVVGLELILK